MLTLTQNSESALAYNKSTMAELIEDPKEPYPQAGTNKGLIVLLDAHTNLQSPGSVSYDHQGFTVAVESKENYPLTKYEGFFVRPGHVNLVALTATKISATERLRTIPPEKRKCLFKEETAKLVMHKEYTQYNCLLECILVPNAFFLSEISPSKFSFKF